MLQYAGGMAAAAILGSEILYANPGTKSALTQYAAVQMTGKYSPFLLVLAFAIFDWYRRRAPFYSGLINTFSKGTLAIYVFHESYYIYPYLWERVFPVGAWFQTLWFIVLYGGRFWHFLWDCRFWICCWPHCTVCLEKEYARHA